MKTKLLFLAITLAAATPVAAAEPAAWLAHLTLGPGDLLNLALFGSPELSLTDVPVGPDGTVTFLEAQDVPAAGLTVDEFRQRLDAALGGFRQAARTIVVPAAFRSKKYFVLGAVAGRGAFTMDRPMAVIEAVARARGLEIGPSRGRIAELADLSRSFLARGGHRVPVDFEKLFLQGDLTQNVTIEPGDYLYFPPRDAPQLYVLGEVQRPGAAGFAPGMTAVAALTSRGGFTDRAWRTRVLVVRGSLGEPQTFSVDVASVLAARVPDMPLQPGDLVYVSARPWIRAEELLDTAAAAFVQAAVIVWTGDQVFNTVR